jgi:hypothetical protein
LGDRTLFAPVQDVVEIVDARNLIADFTPEAFATRS